MPNYTLQSGGYVKFLRGTPAAWNSLGDKDGDTLYFIAETGATKGKLYLGSKLISDGTVNIATTLADLEDILYSNGVTLQNNSLLVYDSANNGWVPKPLSYVLSQVIQVMTGATENDDGVAGLVPSPQHGQQNLFLRGDATWADPTIALTTELNRLKGTDQTGKTIRDIAAEETAKIVASAPETFDTLKEIADWIALRPDMKDITALQNTVSTMHTDIYGSDGTGNTAGVLYDISRLNYEVFGTAEHTGLVDNMADAILDIGRLKSTVQTHTTQITTLQTDVQAIDNKLRWQDLVES